MILTGHDRTMARERALRRHLMMPNPMTAKHGRVKRRKPQGGGRRISRETRQQDLS